MNRRVCTALFLTTVTASLIIGVVISHLSRGEVVTAQELSRSTKVVSAEEFRLVDKTGRTRALLGMRHDGHPGLSLLDENGKLRAQLLLLSGAEPGLILNDKDGNVRAKFVLLPNEVPTLTLSDYKGE